jgi:type II secretion system protein J
MNKRTSMHMRQSERGFTVMELVVTIAIFTIIMGVMFQQIDQAQQSSTTERAKLDVFQEARAFMDLMARDLHEAGYPSPRSVAPGVQTLTAQLPRSP